MVPEQGPDGLLSSQAALAFPRQRHSSDLADAKQKYIIKSKRCQGCLSLLCFPRSLLTRPSLREQQPGDAPHRHLACLPLTCYKPLAQTGTEDQDIFVVQPLRKHPGTLGFVVLTPAADSCGFSPGRQAESRAQKVWTSWRWKKCNFHQGEGTGWLSGACEGWS